MKLLKKTGTCYSLKLRKTRRFFDLDFFRERKERKELTVYTKRVRRCLLEENYTAGFLNVGIMFYLFKSIQIGNGAFNL